MSKNEKELIIRAHGIGFFIVLMMISIIILFGIISIIGIFITNTLLYKYWGYIIISIIVFAILINELIKWIKVNKVIFRGNEFISPKRSDIKYLGINKNCEDFVGYEIVCSSLLMSMEFKFSDGSTSYFHYITFTKKQILQILNEIQKRGGLKDIEIKLDRY